MRTQVTTERDRERMRVWRAKNPEKARNTRREYYVKNRERIIQRTKEYAVAHPEIRLKCSRNWRKRNPEKQRAASKAWELRNPDKTGLRRKRGVLKYLYGLSLETFNEMLEAQNNCCAICETEFEKVPSNKGGKNKPYVDHDHKTGKVRKLLCIRCNLVAGFLETNIERVEKVSSYLREHKNGNDSF